MRRRIIINIDDDAVEDYPAVLRVLSIIAEGRISQTANRRHYCGATTYRDGRVTFATKRTDATDTFYLLPK
jgi:hypothetical protein